MALERGYTMIQISFEGRELLRTLAYQRHKPMYEVLVEAINEALEKEEGHATSVAIARND